MPAIKVRTAAVPPEMGLLLEPVGLSAETPIEDAYYVPCSLISSNCG